MGTDVRTPPDRIAAVSVGVLWGRSHRETRAEQLPVTEVAVLIVEDPLGRSEIADRTLWSGSELLVAGKRLAELELPLLGFNPLLFDWPALSSVCDVDALIARTIDLRSALLPCVAEIVEAEGVGAFPTRGEYGVLHPHRVAETNLGFVPGEGGPLGEAELALALWREFVTHERVVAAGRTHEIELDSLAKLRAERPSCRSAAAWRELLGLRPAPSPYRRRTRHPVTFPRIDQRYV